MVFSEAQGQPYLYLHLYICITDVSGKLAASFFTTFTLLSRAEIRG